MKNLIRLFVLGCLLVFWSGETLPAAERRGDDWRSQLTRTAGQHSAKGVKVGVSVYDLKREKDVFSYKADQHFIPASALKVFITAAALETLGPTYKFNTDIFSDSPLTNGAVRHLYLKGDGNPKLVIEHLWLLVRQLKYIGILRVTGDIIIDDSLFAAGPTLSCRSDGANLRSYCAPVGAASLNFNTVTVYVAPPERPGAAAVISADPECDYIRISNRLSTSAAGGGSKVKIRRFLRGNTEVFEFTGEISSAAPPKTYYLNISRPRLYLGSAFAALLKELDIEFKGRVLSGTVPEGAEPLYRHESEPLWKMAADMNKFSNNFMAEQFLRVLGAAAFQPPGTAEKGLRFLKSYIASKGLASGTYQLFDACGLSRSNRFTPAQLTDFLARIYREGVIAPEFAVAMSVAAGDGTMRKRFQETEAKGRLRAKTGSLTGVASLTGFAVTPKNDMLALTVLLEGEGVSYFKLLDLRDDLVVKIMDYRKEGDN